MYIRRSLAHSTALDADYASLGGPPSAEGFVAVLQHGRAVTPAHGKAFYNSLLSRELTEPGESYTKAF